MPIENIPRSFWHSISAAILIVTVGFTWITYKSGNLTLRYKDFEVITAVATKEIEEAKSELEAKLKESTEEIRSLREANDAAGKALSEAKRKIDEIQAQMASRGATESVAQITALKEQLKALPIASKPVQPPLTESDVLRRESFKQVQQKIDNLGKIQQQLQQQALK